MDIYKTTTNLLIDTTLAKSWSDVRVLIERNAFGRPRDWQLPILACEAVGGNPEQAVPAAAAIACSQISIILIDDMLDEDPRGEYHYIGAPAAANLAVAIQALGLEVLAQSSTGAATRLDAIHSFNKMTWTTALGQHWDVQNPADEAAYWQMVQTKSSPFFGAALYAGARLGGTPNKVARKIEEFGKLYGEMIQIHDDLNDVMATPAGPDWVQGRSPLPILFAEIVNHPDQQRFQELRPAVSNPDALAEAQTILICCGAVSYCVDQIIGRYKQAQALLSTLSIAHPEKLASLLEPLIEPVQALFAEVGLPQPAV